MTDQLLRGVIPELNLRFSLCQSAELCQEALERHGTDWLSGWLLSEALTSAVLLSVNVKGQEKLTIRWMYDGPIGEVMADTTAEGWVRGFPQRLLLMEQAQTLAEAVGKEGRIAAITSTPQKVLHTGITNTVFQEVPKDLGHLLSLSFQVESALQIGLIMPPENPPRVQSALGVLLQAMPDADLEAFQTMREMVESEAFRNWLEAAPRDLQEVLEKVAGSASTEVLERTEPRFQCQCSTEKVENVLRMMPPEELQETLVEEGAIKVHCHFCGAAYQFSEKDLAELINPSETGHG